MRFNVFLGSLICFVMAIFGAFIASILLNTGAIKDALIFLLGTVGGFNIFCLMLVAYAEEIEANPDA